MLPTVVSQLFTKDAVDLWLPMSNDDDLDFLLIAPNPKEATSILGLLLRNAALQVTSNVADELLTPIADAELVGFAAAVTPAFQLTRAVRGRGQRQPGGDHAGRPRRWPRSSRSERVDEAGVEVSVSDRIGELIAQDPPVDRLRASTTTSRPSRPTAARTPTWRPSRPSGAARLAGEVLDCASHRYDAWVTSLATKRLDQLRQARPTGLQLGAWGLVERVQRRDLPGGGSRRPARTAR